ncbi:MAG: valine--tRNA ligase [Bacteroidota bacterium]|nr:valine--tRNA ligase [Bacteroidota bacterium]
MELDKHYNPQAVEDKWYNYWLQNNLFDSTPDEREPYTIVIPPPNVTGVLHMGHMLNNTIQDVLIRKARMEGKNACWVPGTDHASIATEAKVVKMLADKGIKKSDISRDEFLSHAWEWKEKYGGIILEQLKKLGASCDWKRTRFTMEEDLSNAVIDVFIKLYQDGLIYRGTKIVNWDPLGKTTLSDEEVKFKETNSNLVYVTYPFTNETIKNIGTTEKGLTVATTRPETIMGDVAICVHPDDLRYQNLIGQTVLVPIINREIKIISDNYIDIEFGTGCLKVTPAHDENDYNMGVKYQLEIIDVLTDDGKIHERAGVYVGLDRFACRKQIIKDLEELGLVSKIEAITNTVGHSERTDAVIEKKISTQWFVNMQTFMKQYPQVLTAVMDDEIKFYPSKFKNTYKHWLENIKDWNISRQLWWGQRIPAWYNDKGEFAVAKTEKEAQKLLNTIETLKQDEDVLDTWFSSWLWPMSVFDAFKDGDKKDFNYYYPTQDLVTGPDIIFFWVARMVMAGYALNGQKPFSNVYFTGIVRDKQRRKMSKSLGNSPDPLDLIQQYGADSVRMGLLLSAPAGNDILYDETLIEQGRNFCNKLWNAYRLLNGWQIVSDNDVSSDILAANQLSNQWFEMKFQSAVNEVHLLFKEYRLSDALMHTYKLIWDDFCSWYLEMVKPIYGQPINESALNEVRNNFEKILSLLHPFMPFITEELHDNLNQNNAEKPLIISEFPEFTQNIKVIDDKALSIISEIRNIRNNKGLSPKVPFDVIVKTEYIYLYEMWKSIICKLANVSNLQYNLDKPLKSISTIIGTNEMYIPFEEAIDEAEELKKKMEELAYLEGFLKSVESKLNNEKFVANAKPDVIEKERQKKADAEDKIRLIKGS